MKAAAGRPDQPWRHLRSSSDRAENVLLAKHDISRPVLGLYAVASVPGTRGEQVQGVGELGRRTGLAMYSDCVELPHRKQPQSDTRINCTRPLWPPAFFTHLK